MSASRPNFTGNYVNWLSMTYVEDRESVEHLSSFLLRDKPIYTLCWCVHDKDVDEHGELKKVHRHAVVRLPFAKSRSAFAKCFAIRERMCEPCTAGQECEDLDSAFLYLIHADAKSQSEGKFQYPLEAIKGPWADYARERIRFILDKRNRYQRDESRDFLRILDFIDSQKSLSMTELSKWCALNGLWATFRRSGSIVRDVLREHNDAVYAQKRVIQSKVDNLNEVLAEQSSLNALRQLERLLSQAGVPNAELQAETARKAEVLEIKRRKLVDMELLKSIKNA